MKQKILILILISISLIAKSQEKEASLVKNIFYLDEFSIGIRMSTNGYGIDYRHGKAMNPRQKKMYEIGMNIIKHPKEYQYSSYYYLTKKFVYGKKYSCFDIRGGYGYQQALYVKKQAGSVEIRAYMYVGGSLLFMKPIYYEIITSLTPKKETKKEKYNPSHQPYLISKREPFFEGIGETKINPGLYCKIGTSFEHSKNVKHIRSFEIGIEASVYLLPVDIMAETRSTHFLFSGYLGYRMGSIIHKKNKSDI